MKRSKNNRGDIFITAYYFPNIFRIFFLKGLNSDLSWRSSSFFHLYSMCHTVLHIVGCMLWRAGVFFTLFNLQIISSARFQTRNEEDRWFPKDLTPSLKCLTNCAKLCITLPAHIACRPLHRSSKSIEGRDAIT